MKYLFVFNSVVKKKHGNNVEAQKKVTGLNNRLYRMSIKSFFDREKSSPFECGFNPIRSPRTPFSRHFFLIAVIFLIFDVELVVIIPIILCIPYNNTLDIYIIMFIFLFVLIIGLVHE